ncbi:hypothetical protein FXO38_11883 [Capsicum annuum]|nr:hypothetical protein FXO38_11883 [Capsicum annuum]
MKSTTAGEDSTDQHPPSTGKTTTESSSPANSLAPSLPQKKENESNVQEMKHSCVKCACHILNSIVRDGIARFELEIRKVRKMVHYIYGCSFRENELSKRYLADKQVMKLSRKVDIPTRWNTTYDMLEGAMEYKAILTEAYNESIVVDADVIVDDIVINDVVIDSGGGRGGDSDKNNLTDINWIA